MLFKGIVALDIMSLTKSKKIVMMFRDVKKCIDIT